MAVGSVIDSTWLLASGWDDVPRLDLPALVARCSRVVVAAPRPGDETPALAATLADLAAQDMTVTVVLAAPGDDSESGCAAADRAIGERLADVVDASTLVFAPAECDGHPEHHAVAQAAQEVARRKSAVLLNYPILLWHCATPSDVEWHRLRTLSPSLSALRAKASAVKCHTERPSAEHGRLLPPHRTVRTFETVLVPADPELAARVRDHVTIGRRWESVAEHFDALLDGSDDPWHLDDFAYERRRLALVLACLGRERYHRILEIGCATGQLSEELTGRSDEVVALDASSRVLQIARHRSDAVRWICGVAPADLPDETFDAIILSEVGYYLDGPDLTATLRFARRHLTAHGEIVLAHWRGQTGGTPLDGRAVHEQAATLLDLPLRARYEDADVMVEVWGEPISVYREYSGGS